MDSLSKSISAPQQQGEEDQENPQVESHGEQVEPHDREQYGLHEEQVEFRHTSSLTPEQLVQKWQSQQRLHVENEDEHDDLALCHGEHTHHSTHHSLARLPDHDGAADAHKTPTKTRSSSTSIPEEANVVAAVSTTIVPKGMVPDGDDKKPRIETIAPGQGRSQVAASPGALHLGGPENSSRLLFDRTEQSMSDDAPHDESPTIIPSATLVTDTDDDHPRASLEKWILVLFGHRIKVVYLVGIVLLAIGLTVGLATSLAGGGEGDLSDLLDPTFLDILEPISGRDVIADPKSTQYAAVRWLSVHDLEYAATLSPERLIQRYAIVLLLVAQNGVEWDSASSSNATVGVHECEWHAKANGRHDMGVFCGHDNSQSVSRITLAGGEAPRKMPMEFTFLSNLTHLSLVDTFSGGRLPSNIGSLVKLRHLDLSDNGLTGDIPTSVGALSRLSFLSLESNTLRGQPPSELGTISSLDFLNIRDNYFEGSLDFVCSTDALVVDATCGDTNALLYCSCCASCMPAGYCEPGHHRVQIDLRTDAWGQETTFSLTHLNNNAPVAVGGPFRSSSSYSYEFCLPFPATFSLVVYDEFGDGMESLDGAGYVSLFFGGVPVLRTGLFGTQAEFSLNSTHEDIRVSYLCLPDNNWPANCEESQFSAAVEIELDNYPEQVGWAINGDIYFASSPGRFNNETSGTINYEYCVPAMERYYEISMYDTGGDGICCQHGNGYFAMKANDNVVVHGGRFTFVDIVAFVTTYTNNVFCVYNQPKVFGGGWDRVPAEGCSSDEFRLTLSIFSDAESRISWGLSLGNQTILSEGPFDQDRGNRLYEFCLPFPSNYTFYIDMCCTERLKGYALEVDRTRIHSSHGSSLRTETLLITASDDGVISAESLEQLEP